MKKLYTLILLNTLLVTAQNPNCESDQFYGVGNGGSGGRVIYSFTKLPTSVTYNGVFINSSPGGSLAIADLGNGSHFYTNAFNYTDNIGTIQEYNGTNWEIIYTGQKNFQNAAGKGNYLYFHNIKTSISDNEIIRFDGSSLTTIWNDQSVFNRVPIFL